MKNSFLIVGAGFAGAVCARKLADAGFTVEVIDKRSHIAGNAYDHCDEHGILVHKYGPHIFHTNSKPVFEFLSRFTHWRFYEHRVIAKVGDSYYPIPINRTTINALYGLNLSEDEVATYLDGIRLARNPVQTSEDAVLNSVGSDLCEKFFRGYTRKQWDLDLSELAAGVAARIPTRTNDDDRYFTDTFQFIPANGYTEMFKKMLDHPNISVALKTDFKTADLGDLTNKGIIFTGPIDDYYDHQYGKLPYRSLRFEHKHLPDQEHFQKTAQVNYPDLKDGDFTRITEFKYLTGQSSVGTSVAYEFSSAEGDPYYPIPRKANQDLYQKYLELAGKEKNIYFVGRLAQYKYYNMDQVVGAALKQARELAGIYAG